MFASLLVPSPFDHVLVVTWALRFEIFFYAVIALALAPLRHRAGHGAGAALRATGPQPAPRG